MDIFEIFFNFSIMLETNTRIFYRSCKELCNERIL